MDTMNDEMITRREAARIAGVHINTVRLWEQTGRVTTTKLENGVVTIPRSQIDRITRERHDVSLDDKSRIAALEAELRVKDIELDRLRDQYEALVNRLMGLVRQD